MNDTQDNALAVRPPTPLADKIDNLGRLAKAFAASGLFPDCREVSQAMVKIWAGDEMGLSAFESMTGIYIVKGRMTMSANLMAAKIKRSGKYSYRVSEHTADACAIEFSELIGTWKSIGTSRFTAKDAHAAGLGGDNWRKFPRNMLFARAMSNGAKWYCPDVFGGPVYTPDELEEPHTTGGPIEGEIVDLEAIQAVEPPAEARATVASSPQPRLKAA